MERILKGEIWWADLNPTRGREQSGIRPVLIVSRDTFNRYSGTVIALALTSKEPKAGYPLTLPITTANLPKPSWVKIGQIRTLSIDRLTTKIGQIETSELHQIITGLNLILDNPQSL
jgi:mRNA interferase MazF